MAENATNMDSNTEQNLPSQSGCHPIEPETLEDAQVREVDENLSQNNENIEHRTQNETINIPLDENYTSRHTAVLKEDNKTNRKVYREQNPIRQEQIR